MTIEIENVQVRIKPVEQERLKAVVTLDFGDLVIRGFRVLKSRFENRRGEKLWIVPPSYEDRGGAHHPIFFIPQKELWLRLEDKIWEEYARQMEEHYQKQFDFQKEEEKETPIVNDIE